MVIRPFLSGPVNCAGEIKSGRNPTYRNPFCRTGLTAKTTATTQSLAFTRSMIFSQMWSTDAGESCTRVDGRFYRILFSRWKGAASKSNAER
jgi:hypothetical protein